MLCSEGFGQRQLFGASCYDADSLKNGNRPRVKGAEKSRAQNSDTQY
jgi:hypothetical protein